MSVEELTIKLLNAESAEERRQAAEEIIEGAYYNRDTIYALSTALADKDSGVKDICARALAETPPEYAETATIAVAPYMSINNIELRNLAGDVMIKLGDRSVNPLLPYLKCDDHDIRKFACDIIGLIGEADAAEYIYPLIEDRDNNVVLSAIETLGNLRNPNSVEHILKIYDKKEEYNPQIIDALGKIGSNDALEFLMNKLETEEEQFIRVAVIDALAISCEDIHIANKLFEQMLDDEPEMQTILLKTICAVSFRCSEIVVLPSEYRKIAYLALNDTDSDTRAAGLYSLGSEYISEDVKSLIREVQENNSETQMHILYNLLVNSSKETIVSFFDEYCSSCIEQSSTENTFDFLSNIANFWEDVPLNNRAFVIQIILEHLIDSRQSGANLIFEMFYKNDKISTQSAIEKLKIDKKEKDISFLIDLLNTLQSEE